MISRATEEKNSLALFCIVVVIIYISIDLSIADETTGNVGHISRPVLEIRANTMVYFRNQITNTGIWASIARMLTACTMPVIYDIKPNCRRIKNRAHISTTVTLTLYPPVPIIFVSTFLLAELRGIKFGIKTLTKYHCGMFVTSFYNYQYHFQYQ